MFAELEFMCSELNFGHTSPKSIWEFVGCLLFFMSMPPLLPLLLNLNQCFLFSMCCFQYFPFYHLSIALTRSFNRFIQQNKMTIVRLSLIFYFILSLICVISFLCVSAICEHPNWRPPMSHQLSKRSQVSC